MPKKQNAELEKLIEDIIVDCNSADEQLMAFETVVNDAIDDYAKAYHLDEQVYLVEINSNKGLYAGLRAKITASAKSLKCHCWI